MIDRRSLLLGAPLLVTLRPAWAATEILRVEGRVSSDNWGGLESFLFNSLDKVVGLKLRFAPQPKAPEGAVAAYQENGLFLAYLRKPEAESQISARSGFVLQNGFLVLDGFFVVKNAGLNQGITALLLEKTDEGAVLASGASVKDLAIDRLRADIRD